jgi:hypothetical protein
MAVKPCIVWQDRCSQPRQPGWLYGTVNFVFYENIFYYLFKAISKKEFTHKHQDFCSLSRREKGRIASYATLFTTQKADKKTSLWVNSSPEIA